jgi:ubiquinone/menaquinone biosynthesis C-methylase UbiE
VKVIVFLGPSLPPAEARQVLDAVYLPPAGQSDLLSAVTTYRPDVICLIDGVFKQTLSVWHKEILYALERGVRVYGASSMGALRAAETDVYGMVGIGEIYRQYASGELTDDDEVALIHSDAHDGYRSLTEPMVNVRATFRRAVQEGVIDGDTCRRLTAIAKDIYFPDRTFGAVFRRAAEAEIPDTVLELVRGFVATSYVDLKRQDALALLQTVRDLPDPLPPSDRTFSMTRSHLFVAQYDRDRTVRHREVDVPLASIGDYTALHAPDFNDLNFAALNRALAVVLAGRLEVQVSPEEVAREHKRFRLKHGLTADEVFAAWLVANDLDGDELDDLMHEVALCRRLHRWYVVRQHFVRTTRTVLDELRLRNRYEHYADEAAEQERILQERHPYFQETDPDELTWQTLVVDHLRETECRMDVHAALWAEEAGFRDLGEMCTELQRARFVRHYRRDLARRLLSGLDAPAGPGDAGAGMGASPDPDAARDVADPAAPGGNGGGGRHRPRQTADPLAPGGNGDRTAPARLHEFGAVDRAGDPSSFVRYLDLMNKHDDLQHLKQRTYALLDLHPGHRVLDVGCGTGEDVRAMAQMVGPTGCAVGLDSSATLIDVAKTRSLGADLPCEFGVGQAQRLELEDESFDACRADRVLQYVDDPGRAVAEMIRVLRPGGRLVCFEPDWDLQTFDASDRELTRRICAFRARRLESGGVGRELRRYCVAGGMIDVQVTPMAGVMTELSVADAAMGLRSVLDEATSSGIITPDEAARWWAELEDADRSGQFLAAGVAFLVSGRKPTR